MEINSAFRERQKCIPALRDVDVQGKRTCTNDGSSIINMNISQSIPPNGIDENDDLMKLLRPPGCFGTGGIP